MILRQPSSPLFPYTTLFRSRIKVNSSGSIWGLVHHSVFSRADGMMHKDRKSTRLNSSHSQTSYAVFCLKKKRQYGQVAAPQLGAADAPTSTTLRHGRRPCSR